MAKSVIKNVQTQAVGFGPILRYYLTNAVLQVSSMITLNWTQGEKFSPMGRLLWP